MNAPYGTAVAASRRASVRFVVVMAPAPIDMRADQCKGCGLCVDVCPHHVLELDESIVNGLGYHPAALTDPAGCTSCVLCARVCPEAAITVYAPVKGAHK
jgi:2-oxoglutarate ferredoxin oxidoreductase subunit delta